MYVLRRQRLWSGSQQQDLYSALDAYQHDPIVHRGRQPAATRGLLVQSAPPGGMAHCTFEWTAGAETKIQGALKDTRCDEVQLRLRVPVALLDTLALSSVLVDRVTIRGEALASGKPPTLQVSPLGRISVPGGSLWRIENVEISMLSFDWFAFQPAHVQPSHSNAKPPPVWIVVENSSMQCPKCAVHYENGMGASWLRSLNGQLKPDDGSGLVGFLSGTTWEHPEPWLPPAPPMAGPFQWRFTNVSVTCSQSDEAMWRMEELPRPNGVPSAASTEQGGNCYHPADRGESYRGDIAVSASGNPCVAWGSPDQPGGANVLSAQHFPSSGLEVTACRNPLGMLEQPWCYVEGESYIERCGVPVCYGSPAARRSVTSASSQWVTLLAILIAIAGLLLIALLIVVTVKIMHGTWSCKNAATKATPTRTSESASSVGAGRKLSDATTVTSAPSMAPHAAPIPAPAGSVVSHTSRRQSSHGGGGGCSPAAAEPRGPVELAERPVDNASHRGDADRDSSAGLAARPPEKPRSEPELSAQSPTGSHQHVQPGWSPGGYGGAALGGHRPEPGQPWHQLSGEVLHRPHHRHRSADFLHMPNVASPTLQHLIARADSVRSAGAAPTAAPAPAPRPHSAGSAVFPHAHVAHVHARSAAVQKLLLEAETRPRAVEEALAIWNSTDPSQIRAAAMSDSRSHATSSRSDYVQSMHAASGAVNTTPSRATDVQHTDFSTSVLDSGTVLEVDVRGAGGAMPGPGTVPATSSAFSGPVGGGLPQPRPWHTAHLRRMGEPERTASASWEYAAASPTGTHASRAAAHSHGYSGMAEGPQPYELGPQSHSAYHQSVHQSVSSKSETFQSDSLTSLYQVNLKDHDIKIGKVLGRGSFAQVYQGLWNDTAVAIKVIEYKDGSRDAVNPILEASLTKELTHPNVVITYDFGWIGHEVNPLLSVRPENAAMVILMEYCNLKSLSTNIRYTNRFGHLTGPLKWSAIAHALMDVLRGLKYLHEVDIVHGDIKGANVMLKSVHKSVSPVKFTAKLADLGLAQLRGNAVRSHAVSPTCATPYLSNPYLCNPLLEQPGMCVCSHSGPARAGMPAQRLFSPVFWRRHVKYAGLLNHCEQLVHTCQRRIYHSDTTDNDFATCM
eukprot:jgi/Ulvmu1/7724/UM039_0030.1